jgi:hypothetical protein
MMLKTQKSSNISGRSRDGAACSLIQSAVPAVAAAFSLEPGWQVHHRADRDRTSDGGRVELEQYGCCHCSAELGLSGLASTYGFVSAWLIRAPSDESEVTVGAGILVGYPSLLRSLSPPLLIIGYFP